MHHWIRNILAVGVTVALLGLFPVQDSAQGYKFTKVADSAEDGFDPFSFECSAINNRGDIALQNSPPTQAPRAHHPGHLSRRRRQERN